MFRSQTDHHQGDTIFFLTSVTEQQTYEYNPIFAITQEGNEK